jgi:large subunit ribosomal protein L18
MYAQLIDDTQGKTLASASTFEIKEKKNKTEKALEVGKMIAERAQKAGIKEAVFDRKEYKFHGRVKAVADGAKEKGMKI